ncbi:MAG: aldo/keto reductase [Bacilli bacterium]|nr:aldo/keto reductase [Bacilli bacterium]
MEYKKLNNGLEMPILGLGTYQVRDPEECKNQVKWALKHGYRLIDTAQGYNNEAYIGQAIKESGVDRKDIFLTTKINFINYETETCRASLEQSLKNLQTDYLDLVLLHWPFGNYYAAWRVLEEYYEKGVIKAIGVSNFWPDQLCDLIHYNKVVPVINQLETHLYGQQKAQQPWLEKYQVAQEAYAPLGQNRANDMFAESAVQDLVKKYHKTPAQIALRYLTQRGIVVIPKSVHENRIMENIDIFDIHFTEEEMKSLEALDRNLIMIGNSESVERVESSFHWYDKK